MTSNSVSGAEKREPKFEASRSMDVSDQSSVDGSMEDSDKTGSARGDESCSATNLGNCDGNSVYLPEEEEPEYGVSSWNIDDATAFIPVNVQISMWRPLISSIACQLMIKPGTYNAICSY